MNHYRNAALGFLALFGPALSGPALAASGQITV